jgi:ferrous iron transport protein A
MQQSVQCALSLHALPLGATARLVEIRGGRQLQRRLTALGLRVGGELRVEHRRGRGLVVSAGASRVALGGGVVEKLMVVPAIGTDPEAPDALGAPSAT